MGHKKGENFAIQLLKMPKEEAPTPSPGSRKNIRPKCQMRSALAPKSGRRKRDDCVAQERRERKESEPAKMKISKEHKFRGKSMGEKKRAKK